MKQLYEQLEDALVDWTREPYVAVCSSGTAALHLALEALQLPPGSKVIVPDLTMVACARAVTLAGLTPVFVDCTHDLSMDPDAVDVAASAESPRALLAVHIYGRRCPMEELAVLASKYGTVVIEDMAELHGVYPHLNTEMAAWSFYRNKVVAGEEGGAVACKCPQKAKLVRSLRSLGFTPEHDFRHVPRGHNYRMSNCHARLILDSLDRFPLNILNRRRIEGYYQQHCPPRWMMPARAVPWIYDLRILDLSANQQDEVVKGLREKGIAARHCFKPMSHQPEYAGRYPVYNRYGKVPPHYIPSVVSRLSREVIYLPIQPGVTTAADAQLAFEEISRTLLASHCSRG